MKRLIVAAVAAMLAIVTSAGAENYPSRPITIIVPFAAGGPTDALARMLGDRMRQTLGQTIVVENVTGAGGTLGVARAVRAAPDGYTLSIGHLGTHVDQWRDLSADLRSGEGSRSGRDGRQQSDDDRFQERYPGEKFEGTDRLDQSQ